MGSSINQTTARVHVWDLPVRIFHWSLVAAVVTAITTAEIGGDWMELHGKAGLAIIGLLAFRITWGVVGSTHARFANFAPTPAKIRSYLAGRWQGVGHNPLGALAVFGLLGLLAAQAATGLFSSDDIAFNGPLFSFVDQSVADRLTGYHHWLSNVLFALLGLHVGAILFYAVVKRNNLLIPMLTGWTVAQLQRLRFTVPAARVLPSTRLLLFRLLSHRKPPRLCLRRRLRRHGRRRLGRRRLSRRAANRQWGNSACLCQLQYGAMSNNPESCGRVCRYR